MTKTQVKALIAPQLTVLSAAVGAIAINKWARGRALSEMRAIVNWNLTIYGSYKKFIEQEIKDIAWGSAAVWMAEYGRAKKLNYTWKNLENISKQLSYTHALIAMAGLKRRISIAHLVSRFQRLNNTTVPRSTVPNPNRIMLVLSDHHITLFETMLTPYGLRRSPSGKRMDVSSSLAKYLDTI